MHHGMTRADWLLVPVALVIAAASSWWMWSRLGFFGIGLLGLLIGVVAVTVDLERGWPLGSPRVNTHADRLAAEARMSADERLAARAALAQAAGPICVAKVISAGMVILGFGLFWLVQV